ncbi:MAG: STAS domain-containing protein [Gallionella sp.]|nr:STAS domain-containing protein [Gallionella sp.]
MDINVHIPSDATRRAARIAMPQRFDFTIQQKFIKTYTPLLYDTTIGEIEIELSAVDFLDSSALDMLIQLKEHATAINKSVSLLNTSILISRALEITDLSDMFNIKQAVHLNSEPEYATA